MMTLGTLPLSCVNVINLWIVGFFAESDCMAVGYCSCTCYYYDDLFSSSEE